MSAIELRGVTAGYGGPTVIEALDLVVDAGELVALLGANGAGKTTTVRAVCGLVEVRRGSVMVLGNDLTQAAPRQRARVGLAAVPDERGMFTQLTVAENLRVGGRGGRDGLPLESWFPELLPLLGRRAGLLSGGEQTLLALARAIVGRPPALVVDELTTGLAPVFADASLAVLRRAASEWGAGVLLAEQGARRALAAADRAYVLRGGRIALQGAPAEILGRPDLLESTYLGEMG